MDGKSNQMQAKCRSGCGFNGNPATDGFCSACYNDLVAQRQQMSKVDQTGEMLTSGCTKNQTSNITNTAAVAAAAAAAAVAVAQPTVLHIADVSETSSEGNLRVSISVRKTDEFRSQCNKIIKKKRPKCLVCQKKLGLTAVQCRCGGIYCAYHRYSDRHGCTFDYRAHGAQEIRRNNPLVVAEKIRKI